MASEPNLLKRTLVFIGAVADISAVCSIAALFLRQDPLLVLVIAIALVAGGLLLRSGFQRRSIDRQKLPIIGFFFLASLFLVVISWVLLSNVKLAPVHIEIVEPKDGVRIDGDRYLVKGMVGDSSAKVVLVIRPLVPLDYSVQEPPTIDANGYWQANAHFGERAVGIGEGYEIIALATHENFLVTWVTGNSPSIGKREDLPTKSNRSNVVTVTRVR